MKVAVHFTWPDGHTEIRSIHDGRGIGRLIDGVEPVPPSYVEVRSSPQAIASVCMSRRVEEYLLKLKMEIERMSYEAKPTSLTQRVDASNAAKKESIDSLITKICESLTTKPEEWRFGVVDGKGVAAHKSGFVVSLDGAKIVVPPIASEMTVLGFNLISAAIETAQAKQATMMLTTGVAATLTADEYEVLFFKTTGYEWFDILQASRKCREAVKQIFKPSDPATEGHISKVKISICKTLNEALIADPEATNALLTTRVACNEKLASHPTIQVDGRGHEGFRVGLLGLINGIVAAIEGDTSGDGSIAACYENDKLICFSVLP